MRRRLARVGGAIVIAFSVLAVAAWFFVVPAIVQRRVDGFLSQYEPGRRAFDLHSIGLTEATITSVELGDMPWLSIGRVTAHYNLFDLLRGQWNSIELVDPEWRVSIHDGQVAWGLTTLPRKAGPVRIPFESATIRHGRWTINMDGRLAVIPFDVGASTDALGRFQGQIRCADITLDGNRVETLSGEFDFDGSELIAAVTWPLFTGASMSADCAIHVSGDHPRGSIRVQQPAIALRETRAIRELVPALHGIDMEGHCALSAEWRLADGRVDPLLTVRAADVMLASSTWPLAIASASGVLTFDSLSPLTTQGPQRVWIASATTGEIDISAGEFVASLDESSRLHVATARWMMSDGGAFESSPFVVDLHEPRIATKVSAANVDFDFWLRLMTGNRADGNGRLRGEFTVQWDPRADPRLRFTQGSMVATPPTGFIRVHDAPMLSEVLDRSDPRFTVDQTLQTVKRRIIDALEDLGFTRLKIDFVPDGRDTTLRVELEGQGRRGADAQRFSGLVVNIGHFAQALQDVLSTTSAVERMRELRIPGHRRVAPPVGLPPPEMP